MQELYMSWVCPACIAPRTRWTFRVAENSCLRWTGAPIMMSKRWPWSAVIVLRHRCHLLLCVIVAEKPHQAVHASLAREDSSQRLWSLSAKRTQQTRMRVHLLDACSEAWLCFASPKLRETGTALSAHEWH
eukprot:6481149-Amphidinium_carterae.1